MAEVHALGLRFPPGRVVRRMRYGEGIPNVLVQNRQRGAVEEGGRDCRIGPARLRDVEGVRHGRNTRVMHAQWRQAQDLFDGSEHTDGRVGSGDNRTLLHVGSNDESKTAVAADVVGAILRIVFDHEEPA